MKALIVFYSRSGRTRKVAEKIAKHLDADIEEIKTKKSYKGLLGYWRAGRDASRKFIPEISTSKDPSKYSLVIMGTPVWAWNICPPVRSYLIKNKFKDVAFFITGGNPQDNIFEIMEELTDKDAVATLKLRQKEIDEDSFKNKVDTFTKALK